MRIETMRHKLPLLAVGQAQKEYTHNEALTMIDNLLNPIILAVANDPNDIAELNVDALQDDQAWLVGEKPTGVWSDRSNQIALWSENGWRYILPIEGMQIYNMQLNCRMMFSDMMWYIPKIITNPTGGDKIDIQARESIGSILEMLQLFGLSR